jgi:hypothetical protein
MTDIGRIFSPKKPVYKNIALWILVYLIPIIMLAGMFVFGRRRERLSTDVAFARSREALKNSQVFIKQAELALKNGQTREFYDLLMKGMNTYLSEKLNRQLGSVGAALAEELKAKGLKEKECEEFKALYSRANEVIFSSLAVEAEKLKKDFKRANELILRLERILR